MLYSNISNVSHKLETFLFLKSAPISNMTTRSFLKSCFA